MNRNIIAWSLIALLAAFGAACNDDDNKPDGSENPGEELKPVVLPANARVENIADVTAILVWDGSSTEYEVEMNTKVLPATRSISYGLKGLTPETTYSWKVRSKEGERYSEWVSGPDFTTTSVIDYTKGWPGEWQAADFKLTLIVAGMGVNAGTFLPEDMLNPHIDVTIEKKPESIDRILFSAPRLQEISPDFKKIEARIEDNQMNVLDKLNDTLIAPLEYPLSVEDLPEEIAEVVLKLIEELPSLGEDIKALKINNIGIIMEEMNLSGQLKTDNEIPVKFAVSGKFLLETDNALVNTLLKLLSLTVSVDAGMTLYPKQ